MKAYTSITTNTLLTHQLSLLSLHEDTSITVRLQSTFENRTTECYDCTLKTNIEMKSPSAGSIANNLQQLCERQVGYTTTSPVRTTFLFYMSVLVPS